MKNRKLNTKQVTQKLSKEQIITRLKQKNLKGGKNCPPPFEPDWDRG